VTATPVDRSDAAQADAARRLVLMLYASAAITIVAAVVLGLAIEPILFALAGVGVADLVLARLFAAGIIGPLAARRRAEASGDAAAIAAADPSYNPYARED
jgi:hypothetical protein